MVAPSFFRVGCLLLCWQLVRGDTTDSSAKPSSCLIQRDLRSKDAIMAQQRSLSELPEHLLPLGTQIFGSAELLQQAVVESTVVAVSYVGVQMHLRMRKTDNAVGRLPDEGKTDEYGLLTLMSGGAPRNRTYNMLDMGANYGMVPIATFLKYPDAVRAIIVEPIPVTYFFLRWNLWLNHIPEISEEEFASSHKPGILALQAGVAESNQELSFCWQPDNSMNCIRCNCASPPYPGSICKTVGSVSTEALLGYFGDEGLDLLKMDCEGCEMNALPALDRLNASTSKVRMLVGELHIPPGHIEDIACKFNGPREFMTRVCPVVGAGQKLECDGPRKRDCAWQLPFNP